MDEGWMFGSDFADLSDFTIPDHEFVTVQEEFEPILSDGTKSVTPLPIRHEPLQIPNHTAPFSGFIQITPENMHLLGGMSVKFIRTEPQKVGPYSYVFAGTAMYKRYASFAPSFVAHLPNVVGMREGVALIPVKGIRSFHVPANDDRIDRVVVYGTAAMPIKRTTDTGHRRGVVRGTTHHLEPARHVPFYGVFNVTSSGVTWSPLDAGLPPDLYKTKYECIAIANAPGTAIWCPTKTECKKLKYVRLFHMNRANGQWDFTDMGRIPRNIAENGVRLFVWYQNTTYYINVNSHTHRMKVLSFSTVWSEQEIHPFQGFDLMVKENSASRIPYEYIASVNTTAIFITAIPHSVKMSPYVIFKSTPETRIYVKVMVPGNPLLIGACLQTVDSLYIMNSAECWCLNLEALTWKQTFAQENSPRSTTKRRDSAFTTP